MDTQVDTVRISHEGSTKRCCLRDGVIPEAARRIRGGRVVEARGRPRWDPCALLKAVKMEWMLTTENSRCESYKKRECYHPPNMPWSTYAKYLKTQTQKRLGPATSTAWKEKQLKFL